jgi:outer membrane protein assembly factor BamB
MNANEGKSTLPSATTIDRQTTPRAALQLLPAVLIVLVMFATILAGHFVFTGEYFQYIASMLAPVVGVGLLAVWLLFFSHLAWSKRFLFAGLFTAQLILSVLIADRSLLPYGIAMYVMPIAAALPVLGVPLYAMFAALQHGKRGPQSDKAQRHRSNRAGVIAAVSMFVPAAVVPWIRVEGLTGNLFPQLAWRWAPTAEERYLQQTSPPPTALSVPKRLAVQPNDWPGFRGLNRDGLGTLGDAASQFPDDASWQQSSFEEVWRRPIGPGWSSFALVDGFLFTQEQRGEEEAVVCLEAATGTTVWSYTYQSRFYETAANVGPRATPTFDNGAIYALGAKGILSKLDAATGKLLWQRDIRADTNADVPEWGFAASPLVVDSQRVIVQAGTPGSKAIAYDADSGEVCWQFGGGSLAYGSAHYVELSTGPQVLLVDGEGVFAVEPLSGKPLWQHEWPLLAAPRVVQPLLLNDQSLLIGSGYGVGTRRLQLQLDENESSLASRWSVKELWTSRAMKPYFNDYVAHDGYLYGFDHEIFACVDLQTGKRMWKRGRYGFGQVLLLPDQAILLVLSEQGELIVLPASPEPDRIRELVRIAALPGKTWNHPVLADGKLFLRNAEQAVCYYLGDRRDSQDIEETEARSEATSLPPAQP